MADVRPTWVLQAFLCAVLVAAGGCASKVVDLYEPQEAEQFAVSPDGKEAMVPYTGDGKELELYTVDLATGAARLTIASSGPGHHVLSPAFFPNGDLAYAHVEFEGAGSRLGASTELAIRPRDGSDRVVATLDGYAYGLAVDPSGKTVYFQLAEAFRNSLVEGPEEADAFKLDVASGEITRITDFHLRMSSLSVAPNGTALLASIEPDPGVPYAEDFVAAWIHVETGIWSRALPRSAFEDAGISEDVRYPQLNGEGDRIIFGNMGQDHSLDTMVFDLDEGRLQAIPSAQGEYFSVLIPGTQEYAFVASCQGSDDDCLWKKPVSGGSPTQVFP